ncbi:MAG: hypothetical protein ACXV8U_04240 [Methylobacter sp.]
MNKTFSRKIITTIISLLLVSTTSQADSNANGTPPAAFSWSGDFVANAFGPGACSFPINVNENGKGKTITLPGNRQILTSPGLTVDVTNLSDPTKTTNLNITGAFHTTTSGNVVTTVFTGRNLIGDSSVGLILVVGTFSWAFDTSGNLVQPLLGHGKQINVCDLIS